MSLEEVLKSKTDSVPINKLYLKYQQMEESMKHIMILIEALFRFSKEVNLFLSENRDIDIANPKKIAKQLDAITKKFEREIA